MFELPSNFFSPTPPKPDFGGRIPTIELNRPIKPPSPLGGLNNISPFARGLGGGLASGFAGSFINENFINPLGDFLGQKLGESLGDAFNSPKAQERRRARQANTTPPTATPTSLGNPPFKGGQGLGVGYTVIVSYGLTNAETDEVAYRTEALRYVTGPVTQATAYQSGATIRVVIAANGYVDDFVHSSSTVAIKPTGINVSITRNSGQPDTTGDPPAVGSRPNEIGNFLPSDPPYAIPREVGNGDGIQSPSPIPKPSEQTKPIIPPFANPTNPNTASPNSNSGNSPTGSPTTTPNTGGSANPSSNTGTNGNINIGQSPTAPRLIPPLQLQPTFYPPTIKEPISYPPTQPSPPQDPKTIPPETYRPPQTPQFPPNLNPDLKEIKQKQEEQNTLLQNLPFLIPLALLGNQAFNDRLKDKAKEGTCEAAQPDQCLGSKLDADKQEIKDTVSNGNEGVRAALAGILAFLQTMFEWIKAAFNNTVVDKAVSYLTLITTIHNAAMLSTSIKDTLGEALSLGLATVGIKTPEGSPIDINEAINKSTENLIKGVIGASNYTALSETWAKASRIWQSGAAIIYNVRSLWDSARSLDELTNNYVAKIGNSLRRDGVVSENAYKNMSENASPVNVAMEKLNNLDDAASTLAAITSETYGITENLVELTKQREDFEKNVKDFAPKTQIENDPLKAKEDTQKAVSVAPEIPLTELYKPDI